MQALKRNGYFLLIYGLLVFSGGLMGFIKKGSIPSLVAGGLFGLALLWTSVLHFTYRKWGVYLAFSLMLLLEAFFSYRYIMTEAFTPSGLMLILNSTFVVLMVISLAREAREIPSNSEEHIQS